MGALNDFQVALYTALIADSTLTGLIGGADHIGDWVSPDGPYPWITIGEDKEKQWVNKTEPANFETMAIIHVWSKKKGWKEANQILDRLDVILLESQLQLDGSSRFSIIGKGQRPNDIVKIAGDDKGLIRHGVATYKFWISC
jgi:hypothetical protein